MAYTFNGSSQYISANVSPLGNSPVSYSAACFVKGSAQDNRCFLLAAGRSTNIAPIIFLRTGASVNGESTSKFSVIVRGDNNVNHVQFSGGVAFDDTWHHVCLTCNGTTWRIYVDGSQTATAAGTQSAQTFDRFSIGAALRTSAGLFFSGSIAEVGLYDAELTSGQVMSLGKGMACDKVQTGNLVTYIPLVRDIQDIVGGISLTNTNTATVANHPRVYA